ncbi:MAG: hydroxymethylglutaryl-CoA lyase, partial [Pseudomonadota bacterium]
MIDIVEVGPRDGLQNERALISVEDKAGLIHAVADAGLNHIEMGSFVNPERVPQMADTAAVLRAVGPLPGALGMALVPTARHLEEFLTSRAEVELNLGEVAVFVSATESFSQANLGCSVA